MILFPSGWLDCDIIHEVHVCLRNVNPTLGPVRNLNQVNGEFIQILRTGEQLCVCVGSVGCKEGTVNLYDSLYHDIILKEVEDQVLNLVGDANFTGIQVVMAATVGYLPPPLQLPWLMAYLQKQCNLMSAK